MLFNNKNEQSSNNDYFDNSENLIKQSLQSNSVEIETYSNSIDDNKWNNVSYSKSIKDKELLSITVYDGTNPSQMSTYGHCRNYINSPLESSLEIVDSGISSPTSLLPEEFEIIKNKARAISKLDNDYKTIEFLSCDHCPSKNPSSKPQLRLPKLSACYPSPTGIGGIVNRIRSLSISVSPSCRRPSDDGYSLSPVSSSILHTFPDQNVNPLKLPNEQTNSSLNFTNKTILSNRKYTRMSHSLSGDVESNLNELPTVALQRRQRWSDDVVYMQSNSPAMNRFERFLSGHIDTSTPNGALLAVINQGLRKVSESDRYFLFSKSPLRSPVDFLDSGIEHLGDSDILLTVLHHSTCYDLMPENGKLIILDSALSINKAFIAIDDNNVSSAPIWSIQDQSFIGQLGKDNQMSLLLLAYQYKEKGYDSDTYMDRISLESLCNCIALDPARYQLQLVNPENTVCSVIRRLDVTSSSQVLVIDEQRSGNALYMLDHRRILTFLLSSSQFGLPLPSVLMNPVGVTELMINRNILDSYKVYLNTDLATVLKVMDSNRHHCAIVCIQKVACKVCLCTDECIDLLTVDDISLLISQSRHCDPSYKVESILSQICHSRTTRLIYCQEREPVINVIKSIIDKKTPFILINQVCCRTCVHSIISPKELLNYIMKHDRYSTVNEKSYVPEKRKCFRSFSCCEESQKIQDMNLIYELDEALLPSFEFH